MYNDKKSYNNGSHGNNQNIMRNNNVSLTKVNVHFDEKDDLVGDNNKSYVDVAEEVIKNFRDNNLLGKDNEKTLTISKIRNILAMLAENYKLSRLNTADELNDNFCSNLQYFKVRCLYASGRYDVIKNFIDSSSVIKLINDIGNNKKRFINYYHYFEALVAWFKYFGGKD